MSEPARRAGDTGLSRRLGSEKPTPKHDSSFHLVGDLDELTCVLGLLRPGLREAAGGSGKPSVAAAAVLQLVEETQKTIGALSAAASAGVAAPAVATAALDRLDGFIRDHAGECSGQIGFVQPGTRLIEAQLHHARAVSRRCERSFWAFCAGERFEGGTPWGAWLNRLSEALFLAAVIAADWD